MRLSRSVVNHLLRVPVVGRDDRPTLHSVNGFQHTVEAVVDGLYRLDGGREYAGVPDHVRISKVADGRVETTRSECVGKPGGHFVSAHLGLEVVGRYVLG